MKPNIDVKQLAVDDDKKILLAISQQYKNFGNKDKMDSAIMDKTVQQENLHRFLTNPESKSLRHTKTSIAKKASIPVIIQRGIIGRRNI